MLIVCLYVDYLIFTGDFGIEEFKAVMESEFEMTHLGAYEVFLGHWSQSESGIFISQSKYASEVLKRLRTDAQSWTPLKTL